MAGEWLREPRATAGERERELVAGTLREASTRGQLTAAELDQRWQYVRSAHTVGDLVPLVSDLPNVPAVAERPTGRRRAAEPPPDHVRTEGRRGARPAADSGGAGAGSQASRHDGRGPRAYERTTAYEAGAYDPRGHEPGAYDQPSPDRGARDPAGYAEAPAAPPGYGGRGYEASAYAPQYELPFEDGGAYGATSHDVGRRRRASDAGDHAPYPGPHDADAASRALSVTDDATVGGVYAGSAPAGQGSRQDADSGNSPGRRDAGGQSGDDGEREERSRAERLREEWRGVAAAVRRPAQPSAAEEWNTSLRACAGSFALLMVSLLFMIILG